MLCKVGVVLRGLAQNGAHFRQLQSPIFARVRSVKQLFAVAQRLLLPFNASILNMRSMHQFYLK